MIQGSVNQLLGIAGLAGGYLSKARADVLRPQLQAAADRKSAAIDAAKDKDELAKVGEPKASVKGKLTTPIQTLGESKVQESKLKEQYWDKMNSLPDMLTNPEEEGPENMLHPGDDPAEAARKIALEHAAQAANSKATQANNNFITIAGQRVDPESDLGKKILKIDKETK